MNRGYIKLWRASADNPLYFSEPFTKWQAWIDLLIMANHSNKKISVRGILIDVKRGQVLAGEEFLSARWKWSRGKVRRFLAYLSSKTIQQITQQKNNVCGLITILNYDTYQANGTADGTADSTTDGQQTVQQTDIPKNNKNDKNEKNKLLPSPSGSGKRVSFEAELKDLSPARREAFEDWLEYKREKGQRYKPAGFRALIKKHSGLSDNALRTAIDFSMANNYAGLIPTKEKEKKRVICE